ncbi:hypothetical protein GCM10022246_24680 [Pedobacter ginsengiterrae]|uniref:Peptidase S74 domain-containing protein n=1 Tax=Pedobacter ginsengiterrae TaxID=871696 RepID=A0ABP7PUQ4_9SPHI
MPQIQPIDDAYVNEVIKTAGPYNPALNRTQGIKMRELIKLLRDRFEQEISSSNTLLQNRLEKNQANGYAGLDNDGKLPATLIPDSLMGNLHYRGVYDAATNTPTLPAASAAAGSYYIVNIAGNVGGIEYAVGDWIVSDGSFWSKVDNSDAVTTVFGRNGNVLANAGDYNTSQVTENAAALYFTNARVQAFSDGRYSQLNHSHGWLEITGRPTKLSDFTNDIGPATTVFGRTGDIVAMAGDYNTGLVTESPSALYFTNARTQAFADTRYSLLGHSHTYNELNGRPTLLSQFTNDLGNFGNFALQNGSNASGTWNINISGQAATAASASALANYAFNPQVLDGADYIFGRNGSNQINLISQGGLRGFLGLGSFAYRNSILGNEVYTEIGNSGYDGGVASLLRWKNYGSGHVIFDASQGTSPHGSAVGRSNSEIAWSPNYPTLMGWNGANTYGLRVDSARLADNSTSWAGFGYNGSDTAVNSYLMGYGSDGQWHPIGAGNVRSFLGFQTSGEYHRYGGFGTDANAVAENTSSFTYANNAPFNGTLMYFGANGYGTQFNTPYSNGGGLAFRTLNGDNGTWSTWRNTLWNGYNLDSVRLAGGSGSSYSTANLELYRGGIAPNISLHWAGVVASQITVESSGRIAIMDNPGTGYENLVAKNLAAVNNISGDYVYGNVFTTGTRVWTGFDSGVAGSVSASAWFRSSGDTGWYSDTYGGGIWMSDSNYVRTYGDKQFYCNSNMLAGGVYRGENYGSGLVGVYDPSRYQMIFAMGDAYRSSLNGATLDNHYGIAWTHPNAGGQSIPGLSHQAIFTMAGLTYTAIGDGIWTRGDLTVGAGKTSSNIYMSDSDEGMRQIHCNSNRIGFLSQGGSWGSYCNDDGSWNSEGSMSAAGGFYDTSDVRLKNIVEQDIDVSSIKAISYKWRNADDDKIHVGYSAQDVEACLPFAVKTNEHGEKSVRYNEVLVAKIDALEKQLAELMRRIN